MSAKRRIGIFGNFGIGNLGNEGSLEAMLLFLRETYPNAEMVCICTAPDVIREQFDLPSVPIFANRSSNGGMLSKMYGRIADHIAAIRNVRNFDVLLIPGTGFLDDFGERAIGMPYMIFLICLVAKLRGIKTAFVSTGAGPIAHPLSRWFMKTAARMATYRSYRDEISKSFMSSIGVDVSKDPVYPDLAFRLPDPEPGKKRKGKTLIIGLGVMTYGGWSSVSDESVYVTYMGNISSFAVWLLKQGYKLRLLIGEFSDQRAIADLIKAVSVELGETTDESILVDAPNSLNDLMNQIAGLDVVVATRFHNVLCSLKVGKPTISVGYAKKNDVLMESMGLGEFCQHIERLDVSVLKHQFDKLLAQRSIYQTIVQSKKAGLQDKLHQQEMFLVNHVI